ncbi:hypothetical protein [Hymenobacter lapidiphilus]|uniref:Lipoprotein n=1 Tax=Hymenobacter lapidiphilus TaxID=2608003 RepID=A0A7Y7U769_9BACT|nr:hypothetical protein [Hymenobacter lapidiphilus]NVO33117.1 hypothetical protein [Hymenobacter lapidiphilus]
MFINRVFVSCCVILLTSCGEDGDGANGVYSSAALVSSKGDTVFVKSYNWGITSDSQISIVADNNRPIGWDDQGQPGMVKGLDPFQYRFAHDTLTLYTRSPLPPFAIRCPSIVVQYQLVDNSRYMPFYEPLGNSTYHRVPEQH